MNDITFQIILHDKTTFDKIKVILCFFNISPGLCIIKKEDGAKDKHHHNSINNKTDFRYFLHRLPVLHQ